MPQNPTLLKLFNSSQGIFFLKILHPFSSKCISYGCDKTVLYFFSNTKLLFQNISDLAKLYFTYFRGFLKKRLLIIFIQIIVRSIPVSSFLEWFMASVLQVRLIWKSSSIEFSLERNLICQRQWNWGWKKFWYSARQQFEIFKSISIIKYLERTKKYGSTFSTQTSIRKKSQHAVPKNILEIL